MKAARIANQTFSQEGDIHNDDGVQNQNQQQESTFLFQSLVSELKNELDYRFVLGEELGKDECDQLEMPIGQDVWVAKSKGQNRKQQQELFMRAKIIHTPEKDDKLVRYQVQYPAGSTYWVRASLLHPILPLHHAILVWPETPQYRRCCVVQTWNDEHFWEIGCDFGVTTHRVWQANCTLPRDRKACIVGLDKSKESIQEAQRRWMNDINNVCPPTNHSPGLYFLQHDILQDNTTTILKDFPTPNVVAIDINGNRELPAVLQCIQKVIRSYRPRLIIVKSRALYLEYKRNNQKDDDS